MFGPTEQLEPQWEPVVQVLAAMITLAAEYVVLQVYTQNDGECGPYVQTLQEDDGGLTLEAASNEFLDPPINLAAEVKMEDLGWAAPEPKHGMPNFSIFLESDDVEPGTIARFLVSTLRDAYGVTTEASFEFAPHELFLEVLNGDYGFTPNMKLTPFDLQKWLKDNEN